MQRGEATPPLRQMYKIERSARQVLRFGSNPSSMHSRCKALAAPMQAIRWVNTNQLEEETSGTLEEGI